MQPLSEEEKPFFGDFLHFHQARSTGDLAVHAWSSVLESYGENRLISLDISKAFDRVWHKGFLTKVPMFGLHHTLTTWMSSILPDGSIVTRVDGCLLQNNFVAV